MSYISINYVNNTHFNLKKLIRQENFIILLQNLLHTLKMKEESTTQKVKLVEIFGVFCKIGAFTLGGGYAMIPLIEDELEKRGWISKEELPDIIAIAQSAPGILAVNVAVFSGRKLKGIKGSLAAVTGCIIPSFIIILAIAILFTNFKDNQTIEKIFTGIRPAVIALITVPVINMIKPSKGKHIKIKDISILLSIIAGVVFLKISPFIMLLLVMFLAITLSLKRS